MARYVDGYVIPIKKSKMKEYKKLAKLGCKVWMEHGALDYYETIADDLTNFPKALGFKGMCKLKPSETVVFAFIVYKSKADRDRINKKVHKDPRMQMPKDKNGKPKQIEMPFSMTRYAAGGFNVIAH